MLALQAGDYRGASQLIEQSVAIEPRHALAFSNLGVAYRAQDRMLDSIAALETAIGIDPKMADAWVNLAQSQLRAGFTREAVASARRATEITPDRLGARSFILFGANNLAEIDPVVLADEARDYGRIAERLMPPRAHHDNDPDPDRVLKVGLL